MSIPSLNIRSAMPSKLNVIDNTMLVKNNSDISINKDKPTSIMAKINPLSSATSKKNDVLPVIQFKSMHSEPHLGLEDDSSMNRKKCKNKSTIQSELNSHNKTKKNGQKVTTRLMETVEFKCKFLVKNYDKNVFSIKYPEFLVNDSRMTVTQAKDPLLNKFSIVTFKTSGKNYDKKINILTKNEALFNLTNLKNPVDMISICQMLGQAALQEVCCVVKSTKLIEKIEDNELMVKAILKADELAKLFLEKKWDLENEMLQCGLSSNDIESIKKNSAGIFHLTTFLKKGSTPSNATIIGLNHKSIIERATDHLKCKDYIDAYERIFGNITANDDFMKELTKESSPIIFLIPHKLFGKKKGETAKEMEWLLANPEQMKNIQFVFGAYRTYSKKVIEQQKLEKRQEGKYTDYLVDRIFKQIQYELSLPKPEINKVLKSKLECLIGKFQVLDLKPFNKLEKADKKGINSSKDLVIYKGSDSALEVEKPIKNIGRKLLTCPTSTTKYLCDTKKDIKKATSNNAPIIEDLEEFDLINDNHLIVPESAAKVNTYAIFLMGGSGAGKGTIRGMIVEKHPKRNYVIIDPDLIKISLKEYQDALKDGDKDAGTKVHKESVDQAKKMLVNTIQMGKSFIYDSSGSRFWIYEKQMSSAKNHGMIVKLIYVETSVENCKLRAQRRAELDGPETGRFVPEKTIKDTNFFASENFEELKNFAHQWKKYNNDAEKPVLVSSSSK